MQSISSKDQVQKECSIFGVFALEGEQVSRSLYSGLTALQHQGQESAGIAVSETDGQKGSLTVKKGMGLVSEVFDQSGLCRLKGNIGAGRVRYSTFGVSTPNNARPIPMNYIRGALSLIHNKKVMNAGEVKWEQMLRGQAHYTTSDTKILACGIISGRICSASTPGGGPQNEKRSYRGLRLHRDEP